MFKTFRKSSKSVVGVAHNATIVGDVIDVFYQLRSQTLRAPLPPAGTTYRTPFPQIRNYLCEIWQDLHEPVNPSPITIPPYVI